AGPPDRSSALAPMPGGVGPTPAPVMTPPVGSPIYAAHTHTPTPYPGAPGSPMPHGPLGGYAPPRLPPAPAPRAPSKLLWWVLALLAIGAAGGTVAGLLLSK